MSFTGWPDVPRNLQTNNWMSSHENTFSLNNDLFGWSNCRVRPKFRFLRLEDVKLSWNALSATFFFHFSHSLSLAWRYGVSAWQFSWQDRFFFTLLFFVLKNQIRVFHFHSAWKQKTQHRSGDDLFILSLRKKPPLSPACRDAYSVGKNIGKRTWLRPHWTRKGWWHSVAWDTLTLVETYTCARLAVAKWSWLDQTLPASGPHPYKPEDTFRP